MPHTWAADFFLIVIALTARALRRWIERPMCLPMVRPLSVAVYSERYGANNCGLAPKNSEKSAVPNQPGQV